MVFGGGWQVSFTCEVGRIVGWERGGKEVVDGRDLSAPSQMGLIQEFKKGRSFLVRRCD